MSAENLDDRKLLQDIAGEVFGDGVWGDGAPHARALSSLEVMRFLVRIERRFGVTVPDSDLHAKNFASTDAVLALVQRHRRPSMEDV